MFQPPSGGCVLKQAQSELFVDIEDQPPSGGCVLKPIRAKSLPTCVDQPPSGGCVLKLARCCRPYWGRLPAAFGRLCVETCKKNTPNIWLPPAAFGRLCVETFQ